MALSRSRTKIGKVGPSEGARLLWRAIDGKETMYSAAKRLGVSAGTFSRWLYCDRRPSAAWCARIQDVYGIPADAWGRTPTQHFEIPPPAAGERMR
jgi:transcriptional regulator with XRE-family HTH domain